MFVMKISYDDVETYDIVDNIDDIRFYYERKIEYIDYIHNHIIVYGHTTLNTPDLVWS
jgi:hypothetical protein